MHLHIIYTETAMLLSKRSYASWREIQDEYQSYRASVGPWPHEWVAEYLSDEYSDLWPSAQEQVHVFLSEALEVKALAFRGQSVA